MVQNAADGLDLLRAPILRTTETVSDLQKEINRIFAAMHECETAHAFGNGDVFGHAENFRRARPDAARDVAESAVEYFAVVPFKTRVSFDGQAFETRIANHGVMSDAGAV